ncbi:MAG: lytic transglycosylase [Candidatus Rokuibacteriota bacterium]|nr:MAG: lytic transglycosylase [Candidatus Rokubacteria bacterium]
MNSSRRALEARQLGLRHLLGGGVLLLAIVPGYLASHPRGVTDGGHVAADASAPAIRSHIKEAANRYAVSEDLVIAVIEVESRFDARAVSHRGARGLMQLMPATAASLGVRDAFDPRDNIHGGVRHLRWLMDRFDHDVPTVLAAYNAGEKVVLKNQRVPRETREYVKQVMRRMNRSQAKT